MKKLILALLAVGAVAAAKAQSGSILLYGNLGYQSTKTTENSGLPAAQDIVSKTKAWQFAPGLGYQFNKHLTAGINFGIAIGKDIHEASGTTSEDKTRDLEAGLFLRMTTPLNKTFFVFNQLNVSYLNGKTTYDDGISLTPDAENTYNGFGAFWFPAIGVNVTQGMALNFSYGGLGYGQRTWDNDGPSETKEQGFVFTWGNQFNIGVSANLGGKRHMKGHHMEPGMEHRHLDTPKDEDEDAPKKSSDDE